MEAVRYTLEMDTPDPTTNTTRREQLDDARRQAEKLGKTIPEPECPEVPIGYEHVWRAFWRLSLQRDSGLSGASALRFVDIDAYCRMVEPLTQAEVQLVCDMDSAYMTYQAEQSKKRKPRKGGK